MKKNLIGFILVFILCSCGNDVSVSDSLKKELSLIVNPDITVFLSTGDVRLDIGTAPGVGFFDNIRWYETDSKGNVLSLIEQASSSEYVVEQFNINQIRHYVCKVSKGSRTETSKVYSVARTGLPVVSITTDGSQITRETWNAVDLDVDGTVLMGEIKGRGNSSWFSPKKSFSLKLSKESKAGLFDMPEHRRWVLIGNSLDDSLLRNYFASYLGNEVITGHGWNPSYVFVDLVIDGVYWGNYILGEQVKIDKNRVDIKNISDTDAGVGKGGFIVEVNRYLDENFNFVTEQGVPFSLKDPDEVSEDIQHYVQQVIQTAEDALFSDNFKDEETGYSNYFDVDSVIDWYLVNEIMLNLDAAFRSSVYLYYDHTDGKIHMGPNWDFDLSCGKGVARITALHVQNSKWMKRFFEDPVFESAVKKRYSEVRVKIEKAVNTTLADMADTISLSAQLNNARWNVSKDYKESVQTVLRWLNSRLSYLDSQWL